ncbi:hypothetical protein AAY473_011926 [Plecturocebus cupreus]
MKEKSTINAIFPCFETDSHSVARLECRGVISAHCSLRLLSSNGETNVSELQHHGDARSKSQQPLCFSPSPANAFRSQNGPHSVTLAGLQWHDYGSLQPQIPRLKQSFHLSLLSS